MTYLAFHLVFLLPPILILAALVRPSKRDAAILGGISVIAVVYTTPWDNFLVSQAVWTYGPDRIVGTIGYVPIEEYLFFILQPLLTGLFYLAVAQRLDDHAPPNERRGERAAVWPARSAVHLTGAVAGLVLTAVGAVALTAEHSFYLGLILVWSGPVVAGQWYLSGPRFLTRGWAAGIIIPSIYLWIADRIAIGSGIWEISDIYTLGIEPFGLPVEEALFFLMTNVLVVQGVIMLRGNGR